MVIDETWDVFYEHRVGIATGATEVLSLPPVMGGEQEYIKFVSALQSNAGARNVSLGVLISSEFYRFHRTVTGAAFQVVSLMPELTLTDGMIFQVEFGLMVANDAMEMWVHGFRKRRKRS